MYSEYGYGNRRRGCLTGCLAAFGVLAVILVLGWIFLPRIGAKMLLSDSALSPVPREARTEFRNGVNRAVTRLDQYGISRDKAVKMVESLSAPKVERIMDSILAAGTVTADSIVEAVSSEVDLTGADREAIVKDLGANLDREEFVRVLRNVREGRFALEALVPVFKRAALEVLNQSR